MKFTKPTGYPLKSINSYLGASTKQNTHDLLSYPKLYRFLVLPSCITLAQILIPRKENSIGVET